MKELRKIIQAFDAARQQNKNAVLATVVHIEGSAYRAPGARMLITEDGMLTGAISGGCLEGDVLRKAMSVMIEQKPLLITYDTSDDESDVLGVSLGCNGIIRILLEPIVTANTENPVSLIRRVTQVRKPSVIVTFFTDERKHQAQGTSMAMIEETIYWANRNLPVSIDQVSTDIRKALSNKQSSFVQYLSAEKDDSIVFTAFIEYVPPVPSIVVAGAGNDVLPVAQMAAILGWDISLIDGRPAYASAERFPGCQLMISKPEEALNDMEIDEQTAILLMSHNYPFDKAILRHAIGSSAKYIGILGPKKKRDRLFKELSEEGLEITPDQEARVFGPTGLDIGAESSEEIALSIITEIKAVFEGKSADSLRDRAGHIHERQIQIKSSKQHYAIIVLAAGQSKRLGQPKQELIYNGDTLIHHAVKSAIDTGTAVTVVVAGENWNKDELAEMNVKIAVNPNPEEGMSASIRIGMAYLQEHYPEVRNILIMLCDQPLVNTVHLNTLIEKHQSGNTPVVASFYAGRKGVPAIFNEVLFEQLNHLEGDTGAKHLIESLGNKVSVIDFPAGALDIDTQESYQEIINLKKAGKE